MMAKPAVKSRIALKSKIAAKRTGTVSSSLVEKRLHRADGQQVRILSIDANSPSFGDDLEIVFRRNVAKAKRENNKIAEKAGPRLSKQA